MSIRAKVIFSFLSLLVVPFLMVLIVVLVVFSGAFPTPSLSNFEDLSTSLETAQELAADSWFELDDPLAINERMAPILDSRFRQIIVVDMEGVIKYDSLNPTLAGRLEADVPEYEDLEFLMDAPIMRGGFQVGTVKLLPNIDIRKVMEFLVILPVVLIVLFVITIIAMIIILSKILADGILKPMNQLGQAAERIAEGQLDFEIPYTKDDEIGRISKAFDNMRVKLKASLEKQEQYETSRRRLIASISHDLRTPLTSIKGYVEGLQDGLVTDEETKDRYLRVIQEKTGRLNHLIDDLFIFSKMSLGEFQIDQVTIPCDHFLEELMGLKEMELGDHPIDFQVNRPFPEGAIHVDPDRIGQVIDNLVDNALKFAQSSILIRTHLDEGYLKIFVQDDGPGIPADDLPMIFDHFYKVDQVRSTKVKGTGLGLAICKQLVEAHGGAIHVKSREGKGTTFRIEIPVL